ncbi:MAG: hypothetical protein C0475_03540 [Planctomyces sp.]|nr:hypothetical protein [Planctomyces sp.]MBA4039682.1 hypothetical protein [Planctomyces sp.]MBA4119548.1 hypothetical protein [Isosphaera sp.]
MSYTFALDFFVEPDPLLLTGSVSGAFSARDLNSNGVFEFAEFESFSFAWTEVNAGFGIGSFTLGLADLDDNTFFADINDYALFVTRPGDIQTGRGFSSFSDPNSPAQSFVGFSFSEGSTVARFSSQSAVSFTLVPAPATAALLGLGGVVAARRRRA